MSGTDTDPLSGLLARQAELLGLLERATELEPGRLLDAWQRCSAAFDDVEGDTRFSAEALRRARHLNGLLRARLAALSGDVGRELERVRAARGSLASQHSAVSGERLDMHG